MKKKRLNLKPCENSIDYFIFEFLNAFISDFESSYWHFQQIGGILLVEDLKFLSPGERVGTKEMGIFSSRLNNEGTYDPSWFTLWMATHSKTTYVTQEHPSKYQGNKPILVVCTGKYLSEALILASTNPQYDGRLSIELRVQYMKVPSSEHVENILRTY